MKKRLSVFGVCLLAVLTLSALPLTGYASAPVDPERESSLTLVYRRGETAYAGLEITVYRVAEVFPDGTYALTGAFSDYPVNIDGITAQSEWDAVASTLAAYAQADGTAPTGRALTDGEGTVQFFGILPGMYLTTAVRAETAAEVAVFESFLTVLPYPEEDGGLSYAVSAFPKCESYTPKPDPVSYKVVKQWKDNGYTAGRPASVAVDILKDGVLQSTQTLSAENDWLYEWTAPDDGSLWQAVERSVPSGYTVTVAQNGSTILITNAYDSGTGEPPKTGDTFVLWPYALAMGLSGALLILLAIWRQRKNK